MIKILFLTIVTGLLFSKIAYGENNATHSHGDSMHIHPLPIEGLNHIHSGLQIPEGDTSLIFTIKNPGNKKVQFGSYSKDQVKALWLNQGRKARLLETLVFTDPKGKNWIAPKGHIIDGASIPALLQPFIGSPYGGKYVMASIIHDVACDEKKDQWREVHKVFHFAMLASGVPVEKANLMYDAVYKGGPRWGKDAEKRLSEKELERLLATDKFNVLTEVSVIDEVSVIGGELKKYGGKVIYTRHGNNTPTAIGIIVRKNDFSASVELDKNSVTSVGINFSAEKASYSEETLEDMAKRAHDLRTNK